MGRPTEPAPLPLRFWRIVRKNADPRICVARSVLPPPVVTLMQKLGRSSPRPFLRSRYGPRRKIFPHRATGVSPHSQRRALLGDKLEIILHLIHHAALESLQVHLHSYRSTGFQPVGRALTTISHFLIQPAAPAGSSACNTPNARPAIVERRCARRASDYRCHGLEARAT